MLTSPPSLHRCRRVIALAQRLVAWAPQAAEVLDAQMADRGTTITWLPQFAGACRCIQAMAKLARAAGVQPSAAFRITAACQLVFDVGRRANVVLAANLQPSRPAGWQPHFDKVVFSTICHLQLAAVEEMLCLLVLLDESSSAAAAFARSTARPSAMLPWLGSVAQGLLLTASVEDPSKGGWSSSTVALHPQHCNIGGNVDACVWPLYKEHAQCNPPLDTHAAAANAPAIVDLIGHALTDPAFADHAAAIAAHPTMPDI